MVSPLYTSASGAPFAEDRGDHREGYYAVCSLRNSFCDVPIAGLFGVYPLQTSFCSVPFAEVFLCYPLQRSFCACCVLCRGLSVHVVSLADVFL